LTHIGLCVSDLDESAKFYTEALEFEELRRLHVDGPETGRLLDVPGAELDLRVGAPGDFRIDDTG